MESTIFLVLVVIAAIALYIIKIHNDIISMHNTVKRSWADVVTAEKNKLSKIPSITEIAEKAANQEVSLIEHVTALRNSISKLEKGQNNTMDYEALMLAEASTQNIQKGLSFVMEAYPEFQASGLYRNLMQEMVDANDHTEASIRMFNRNVEFFNTQISVFPNVWVNDMFSRRTQIKEFSDSKTSKTFEYSPNI